MGGLDEVTAALKKAPELWPILQQMLLALIDALIAKLPVQLQPSLKAFRDKLAVATTIPPTLIDDLMAAIQAAVLTGDYGPATADDSDLA